MDNISISQVVSGILMLASFISACGVIMKEARKPIKDLNDKLESLENKIDDINTKFETLEDNIDNKISNIENRTDKISRDLKMNMMISKYLLDISPDNSGKDIKDKFNEYLFNEATKEEGYHGE